MKTMKKKLKKTQNTLYEADLKLRLEIAEKIKEFTLEFGLIADDIKISNNFYGGEGDNLYTVEISYRPTEIGYVSNVETIEEEVSEFVDLGLSVKWATRNVGANKPDEYGDYFSWGETETKEEYTEENSKTCGKSLSDISGDVRYDVSRAKWGSSWRIPTKAEMEELIDRCQWEWTTVNEVKGYKVTGLNGNSIFLPAAGYRDDSYLYDDGLYGNYWSSTPYEDIDNRVYYLDFNNKCQDVDWNCRFYGHSVRPVLVV